VSSGEQAPARGGAWVARGLTRATGVAAGVGGLALSLALSGCANSAALALARRACGDVNRSLALYQSAETSPGSAKAAVEREEALGELRTALPIAATAAGEAPQWQALMATLSESSRMPESDLAYALSAQCAVADGTGEEPPVTTATPPTQ